MPTTGEGGAIPVGASTVEVRLPFVEFADSLGTYSGYGSPASLLSMLVANAWIGDLSAYTLVRFGATEPVIFVRPVGQNSTVPETHFHAVGARVVVYFDSASAEGPDPIEFGVGAVPISWHPGSASWEFAADTVGGQTPWAEGGAGPTVDFGSVPWVRGEPDSITVNVDSAAAAGWLAGGAMSGGARLGTTTAGARVAITKADVIYSVRPDVRPDTLIDLPATAQVMTVIYSPDDADPDPGTFRIGGAPARRAVLHLDLPEELTGPPALCAAVSCPLALLPSRVLYASVLLTPAPSVPAGLIPLDTLGIDLRPVLAPDRLPRSPLGRRVRTVPTFVPADVFGGVDRVELTMTNYLRDLLTAPVEGASVVPPNLAVLTALEPWSLEFGTFWGPGSADEPMLRLILTVAPEMPLP
jgi:hypothetical protein